MPSPIIPTAKSVNAGCCFWVICISNYGDPAYRQSEEFHPRSKVFRHNAGSKAQSIEGVLPRQMRWRSAVRLSERLNN
jgi:hypothetical protein